MIDGLNICHEYSKHLIGIKFSAEGLNVAYEHFKKLGYEDEKIVIIMKQIPQRYNSERIIAQKLEDKNVLHYAPSRRSGMKKTIIEGLNPIPTSQGRNQPLCERHVTKSGRNRVKSL